MKTIFVFSVGILLLFLISSSISAQIPAADFTATPRVVCVGEPVQFSDLSSNNPTSWSWYLPGGSPSYSALQNPIVIYSNPGNYDVSLTAIASNGEDIRTKGVYHLISVMECTSISIHYGDFDLNVFPNPTSSFLCVSGVSDARYVLFDAVGSVLVQGQIVDDLSKIHLDNFAAGVYFLRVQQEYVIKILKVIKE